MGKFIIGCWAVFFAGLVLLASGALDLKPKTLECSVDDTLTFVAYDVRVWHIRNGMLRVHSTEVVLERVLVAGETCVAYVP